MKPKQFLVISDLHFDQLPVALKQKQLLRRFSEELINFLKNEEIDALLIAGDISGNLKEIEVFFKILQEISIPKIYVPGNHEMILELGLGIYPYDDPYDDIWYHHMPIDMNEAGDGIYRLDYLKKIAPAYGIKFLMDNPCEIFQNPKTVVIGNIGWYNFTHPYDNATTPAIMETKNTFITYKHFYEKPNSPQVITEKTPPIKSQFFEPNVLFWKYCIMCLKYQIEQIKRMEYEHLLFLSHFIPLREEIPYKYHPLDDLEDFLLSNENAYHWFYPSVVSYIKKMELHLDAYVFGHTHKPSHSKNHICNPFIRTKSQDDAGKTVYIPENADSLVEYFKNGIFRL